MKLGKRSAGMALAAVTLAVAALVAAPGAHASSADTLDAPRTITVPMMFGGFDVARATQYGYDIRTDDQGWQYAVPTGTPSGSTAGASAKYNPATGQVMSAPGNGQLATPMNTQVGNCGTSTLTLYTGTSGYTGYNLDGSLGGAIYHTWRISISAKTGNQLVNRDGLPPYPGVSLNWGTNFAYNVHAGSGTVVYATISTGVVETELGRCYAYPTSDHILT